MITLKNTLILNGVSSGATGLGLVLFSNSIAEIFGVAHAFPFVGTGAFLLLFASLVFYVARQNPIKAGAVLLVTFLDVTWVIASFGLLLLNIFKISLIGQVAIGGVAMWVAAMAYLQSLGVKKMA